MRNGVISEKTDDLNQSVIVFHRSQKAAGELGRSARAFLEPGHVDELDRRVNGAFGREERRAAIKPLVRDSHHSDVRVALRRGGGVKMRLRDRLKKRRLA